MTHNDTICALATATGGALAIIRISGPQAFTVINNLCSGISDKCPANSVRHTYIVNKDGETIDDVVVSIFKSPHSYTGEDSVEITCHGSSYISQQILKLLTDNGCRMAQPGEYTMRAYLNGKLDLSQAEAVADLIASTNQATHRIAMNQLRGGVSTELSQLRDQLLKLTSLLELELDFSDHEELEFADRSELLQLTQHIEKHITKLARSFEAGQAIKQGIPVAIIGKTNVGKSTPIVSDIHGTTRDTIEDTIDINGVTFRFIDTAGIRQTSDEIEQIGINRTYQAIEKARIVLWIIDDEPTKEEIGQIATRTQNSTLLIVQNKIDKKDYKLTSLPSSFNQQIIRISAKTGLNINTLEEAIYSSANIPSFRENDTIITSARHYDTLIRAHENLQRVLEGMVSGLSGDLLAEDLRQVLDVLAEITGGQITPQETLNNIFKHFCVGK